MAVWVCAGGSAPLRRGYAVRIDRRLELTADVCGCVGVWVCGCVGVWVCGCVGVWVCGCVGVWVCGCVISWWRFVVYSRARGVLFSAVAASSFIFFGLRAAGFAAAGECGGFTTFDNKIERRISIDICLCYFFAVSYNYRSWCAAVAA